VIRDISIVLSEKFVAADAVAIIKSAASELLVQFELIDLYTDTGIESGKKSLTFRLTLQSNSRSLTDEEADHLIDAVLKRLGDQLGAVLRSR
jgi:phenylalanyl-tRNA synthetase beta chain